MIIIILQREGHINNIYIRHWSSRWRIQYKSLGYFHLTILYQRWRIFLLHRLLSLSMFTHKTIAPIDTAQYCTFTWNNQELLTSSMAINMYNLLYLQFSMVHQLKEKKKCPSIIYSKSQAPVEKARVKKNGNRQSKHYITYKGWGFHRLKIITLYIFWSVHY